MGEIQAAIGRNEHNYDFNLRMQPILTCGRGLASRFPAKKINMDSGMLVSGAVIRCVDVQEGPKVLIQVKLY